MRSAYIAARIMEQTRRTAATADCAIDGERSGIAPRSGHGRQALKKTAGKRESGQRCGRSARHGPAPLATPVLASRIRRGRSAVTRRRHDRGDDKNFNDISRKLLASTGSFEKTEDAQRGALRERTAAQLAYIVMMTDEIAFLYGTAAELRAMAAAAPDIGEELRRMAEELEEEAGKLMRNRHGRHGSDKAQPL